MTARVLLELAEHEGLGRDPAVARLARLLASWGHVHPSRLDDRALAAMINAQREANQRLQRHFELERGQL